MTSFCAQPFLGIPDGIQVNRQMVNIKNAQYLSIGLILAYNQVIIVQCLQSTEPQKAVEAVNKI